MSIKIIIADDHKLVSTSVIPLLNIQPGMQVVAEVGSGKKAVDLAATLKPDIVIMDIGMAELNGIEATRQIVAKHPRIKIIMLTMHADRRYITEALNAGASEYLTKGCFIVGRAQGERAQAQGSRADREENFRNLHKICVSQFHDKSNTFSSPS